MFLNDYNHQGPYVWATQIKYDPMLVQVVPDHGYGLNSCLPQWGVGVPLVFDAWKETVIDVDLDADVARLSYDGTPIGEPFSWSQGPFGHNGGAGLPCPPPAYVEKAIECVNVYANSTTTQSRMFWDDLSILPSPSTPVPCCTPGGSTNGCVPAIAATANPNIGHSNVCQIAVANVEGQKSGIVFYGLGSISSPWCASGGASLLCVKAPTQRAGVQSTGGTAGSCDGTLSLDWNAYQIANPGSLGQPFAAGAKAHVQGWFRDPPACKTTNLTAALQLTYTP